MKSVSKLFETDFLFINLPLTNEFKFLTGLQLIIMLHYT